MPLVTVNKTATLSGHNDCIYTLEKSMHEHEFFSGAGDGMVVRWDQSNPKDGQLVLKVPNSVYALALDDHYLYVGNNFQGIHKVDLLSGKEVLSASITTASIFDIKIIGSKVFVAMGDGMVKVLQKEDLSVLAKLQYSTKSARCIAINESKKEFVVGFSDNFIRVFHLEDFRLLKEFKAHDNSVFTVCYAPNGKELLSAGRDAHLRVWDEAYEEKQAIVGHMYTINHIVYSPEGNHFATCSMDKSVKVWDAHTYRLLKVIDKSRHAGHGTSVNKLFWSTYNNELISASDDRTISIWDINI